MVQTQPCIVAAVSSYVALISVSASITAPSQVVMDNNFKWNLDLHPTWTSVFLGTNDINPHFPNVQETLSAFEENDLELVTVVGGSAYLRLLESTSFRRIHFFDANINELTKLRTLHEAIVKTDYDSWVAGAGMRAVAARIKRSPETFFLPHGLASNGVRFHARGDFQWPIPGVHFFDSAGRVDPLWSMLAPDSYPEFIWKPSSKEAYENVRRQLATPGIVSDYFHLSLPCAVVHPESFAVVYVNGAQIPAAAIRAVHPLAMAVGIYSAVSRQDDLGGPFDWYQDAHTWWEYSVRRAQARAGGASMHVWAPEDKMYKGSIYDWHFDASATADENIANDAAAESITMHMLVGKAAQGVSCAQRNRVFVDNVRHAVQSEQTRQIIITEHNRESGEFPASTHPCALSSEELKLLVTHALDGSSALISKVQLLPGKGKRDRNMMIIATLRQQKTADDECDVAKKVPSVPSKVISVSVNGRDRVVPFPAAASKSSARVFAASACLDFGVLTTSCIDALEERIAAEQTFE